MPARARTSWRLSADGHCVRQIGWTTSRTGNRTQKKFSLGANRKAAIRRAEIIRRLWVRLEEQGRLQGRTEGRSSPAAAIGFVVGGPVLGVLLLIIAAIEEARRVAASFQASQDILGLSVLEFCFVTLATGLATALVFGR
jgi:hypothetical protein